MKKFLLTLLFTIAYLLPPPTIVAAETFYTIEFATGSSTDGTSFSSTTKISDLVTTASQQYVAGFSSPSTAYYGSSNGLRLGSKNNVGSVQINLTEAAQVVPTKIVATIAFYGSDTTAKFGINDSNTSSVSAAGDYTVNYSNSTKLSSITLYMQRGYVKSVNVYYETSDGGGSGNQGGGNEGDGEGEGEDEPSQPGDNEAKIYEKVSSLEREISDDDKFVIIGVANPGNNPSYYAFGKFESGTYGPSCDNGFSVSDGANIVTVSDETKVEEFTFEKDASGYVIKTNGGKYLTWSSGNTLGVGGSGTAFTVSIDDKATIKVANATEDRYITYNQSSPRFACYTTYANNATNRYIYLYRLKTTAVGKVTTNPVSENDEITVGWGQTVSFYSENAEGLVFQTEYDEEYSTAKEVENNFVYTVKDEEIVTVYPKGHEELTAVFYIMVTKPEKVISEPADEDGVIEIAEGKSVRFTSKYATALKYSFAGKEETKDGESFEFTPAQEGTITVTPLVGTNEISESASTFEIKFKQPIAYKLVTDIKDVKVGKKYIIVSTPSGDASYEPVAIGGTRAANNLLAVGVEVKDNSIDVVPDSEVRTFVLGGAEGEYTFYSEEEEKYLQGATSDANQLKYNATTPSKFKMSIETAIASISYISNGTTERYIAYNSSDDLFNTYKEYKNNATNRYVSLYREVDEEYVEAPEALYLFGDFGTYSSWDLTKGVEVKPLYEGSNVYSAEAMFIGTVDDEGNPAEGGYFVMATAQAPKSEIATAAIPQSVDWASLGDARVIYPNEHGENALEGMTFNSMPASEVEQSSLNMYYVAEPGLYNITVDFSGYTPEVSQFAKSNETQTGIENVAAGNVAEVEYYNLQGVRVLNPSAGIYIRRQGSSVSKIMVK